MAGKESASGQIALNDLPEPTRIQVHKVARPEDAVLALVLKDPHLTGLAINDVAVRLSH